MKIGIVILAPLLPLILLGGGFDFKEVRYYKALTHTVTSFGHVDFDTNSTVIAYTRPVQKKITLEGGAIYIESGSTKERLQNDKIEPMIQLFKMLLHKDSSGLERFFTIQGDTLVPRNNAMKRYVEKIELQKEQDFVLTLSNGDRVEFIAL